MPRLTAAAAALAALLLAGCATAPWAPEPTSVDHGMLVVRAKVRGAVLSFTSDLPDQATVEQIDEHGEAVPGKVAVSGPNAGGEMYFVDLPPGRYSLTSFSFPARGVRYDVALSTAVVRRYAVELKPGKAAFLGDVVLDGRFPDFDVAVERALDVLGHWITPFLRRPRIDRDADLRGVDQEAEPERQALLDARKDFAGTQWRPLIEARLREMGAMERAPTEGVLRSREVPLRPFEFFSWRDTLKWGEPARAPNGLAWRRPGGEARVAVFFTTGTAAGFAGYQEAVRQLRAAAGAVDDPEGLFEVRVGTRAGQAARVTSYRYPESTLMGSQVSVIVTETVLVDDPLGMFTARLRAPRDEFEKVLPQFREFLLQLVPGPPPKVEPKQEPILPL